MVLLVIPMTSDDATENSQILAVPGSDAQYRNYIIFARVNAAALMALGLAVTLGWVFGIELLKSVLPGHISMKANTAIGFLAAGCSLGLLLQPSSNLQSGRNLKYFAAALAGLVVAIGGLNLVEYAFHTDLKIDQLFFADASTLLYPGRLAPISAINFCLVGTALLWLALSPKKSAYAQLLAAITGLCALLAIIGYLYGVPLLYGSSRYTSMALHTGAGFLFLSLGVLCCRPAEGVVSILTSHRSGGWISRKLLPVAVLAPIVLGAVAVSGNLLVNDVRLAVAALMISQVVLFAALIWVLAFLLNRGEEKRADAEQALAQSKDLLRQSQKMEAIGLLAGGVAHDFNNLLGVIIGYSSLLLEQRPEEDATRRKIEHIKQAGESAASLTRQLLAFSRQQVLQPRVLNLNTVIRNLEPMMQRLIREDIEISTSLDPALGAIKADPGQVEQIILNLAVNARDAMPQGGNIRIATANMAASELPAHLPPHMRSGACMCLSIRDSGTGMDEATRSRIFEPFFTTKALGHGTGLGLATVHGILKQSGGHIHVESQVDQGTTFKIYLPLTGEAQWDEPALPAPQRAPHRETILVVEDAAPLREMLCESLRSSGRRVLAAHDGAHALQLCENEGETIALLITDVVMPVMSGRELVERVRTTRPSIKVLYISGYTDDVVVHNGVSREQVAFLQKPFTTAALLCKVTDVLDAAKSVAQ